MEIIRDIHNIKPLHQGCVVTIGNFDGLHLGHQALLSKLRAKSQELGLPSLAIIFEPQPNEFFAQKIQTARLMRFREKITGFKRLGVDRVLCLRFKPQIANLPAELFVRKILFEKLAAKYVLVGDDFKFGYQRQGDYNLLQQLATRYLFMTDCMDTLVLQGERVSSTRIRLLLEQGDLDQASTLLGETFSMVGRIAHGDKRGRILGFPTANIHLHRKLVPISGVFAVAMLGVTKLPLHGVANVGTRPTITGDIRTLLEVHLLNFNKDIYGTQVEIRFLHKFRDEKKFNNLEDLKIQISKDILETKKYFGRCS